VDTRWIQNVFIDGVRRI